TLRYLPRRTPMKFELEHLRAPRREHLCLLHDSAAERDAAVGPFLRRGLDANRRCAIFAGAREAAAAIEALRAAGGDAEAALKTGALVVLPHDREIVSLVREESARARTAGFAGLCIAGEMSSLEG